MAVVLSTGRFDPAPALILGDDPINGLGVARNLGRSGIRVARLGTSAPAVLRSGYIRSTHCVPDLEECPDDGFVRTLRAVARRIGGRPVIFPISDLHVLRVARNAEALTPHFRLLASSWRSTETLVNKRLFYESLELAGVPHPRTRFPRRREEFAPAAAEIGYPVLLKPEISPLFARRFRRKGFVASTPGELDAHLRSLEGVGLAVMVQEIIPGPADCMHGCAGFRSEACCLTFAYRRVREFPPGFGCGSLLVGIPSFVESTGLLAYFERLGYTGIFDAEFKLDPRDGRFKVIEVNARSWWQNTHPSLSGLNLVRAAYDHAIGRPVADQGYRSGAKWIHLYNDYHAARAAGMSLRRWLGSLSGEREFDILAVDDLRPTLAYVSTLVDRFFLSRIAAVRVRFRTGRPLQGLSRSSSRIGP